MADGVRSHPAVPFDAAADGGAVVGLDHVIPHACGGETDCANLCCLCRSHHRLKPFARDWSFVLDDDGTLHVTTPSGVTRTTRPPGMRPPAPGPPETGGSPPTSPDPDDELPPF